MAKSFSTQTDLIVRDNMSPVFGSISKNADIMDTKLKNISVSCNGMQSVMDNTGSTVNSLSTIMDGTIDKYDGLNKLPEVISDLGKKSQDAFSKLKELGSGLSGISDFLNSVAELAKSLEGIGALGTKAVIPLITFGAVVGGLASVFSKFGAGLLINMAGISAFGVAISSIALAMAPLLSTGYEGAQLMTVFAFTVAALASVFAAFGQSLNLAVPGMLAFGASILLVGAGLQMAAPFVSALTSFIQQLGITITQVAGAIAVSVSMILGSIGALAGSIADAVSKIVSTIGGTLCNIMVTAGATISEVADSISEGFLKISDGVTQVIDAISGGLSDVLNSIAGVIESVGTSAKNAGEGFKLVAEGIQILTGLNILKVGAALLEVATGIGLISTKGKNLPQVAIGMQNLMVALAIGTTSIAAFSMVLISMSTIIPLVITSLHNLKTAFDEFTISPPDTSLFIAAFNQIIVSSMMLVPALTLSGQRAGAGLAAGLSSGAGIARNVMALTSSMIIASLNILSARLLLIGSLAGNGFALGLQNGLSRAAAVTLTYIRQINAALVMAQTGVYNVGRNIGLGLARGMRSTLGTVKNVAAQLAVAAKAAIEAKAKIASPSKVTTKLGQFFGQGWVNGIGDMINQAKKTAAGLVNIPRIAQPEFAASYSGYKGYMNDDYIYGSGGTYVIEVPVNIDGREVSKVTAPYMQSDLNRMQTRESRKRGRR